MAAPTEKNETREIPALTVRADFKPGSIDVEKRTAELVFTTGARVRRGFWEPFDEELSLEKAHVRMDRLTSGRAPLLDSHSGYSLRGQIGVIESASLTAKEGTVKVRFSKRADVEPIFQDVVDGIIRGVSVGYQVHKYERVQEGDSKTGSVPVYRAVDWTPAEVSLTPIPADASAHVRSAHPTLPLGDTSPKNTCLFITRSEEPTIMDPIKPEPIVAPVAPAAVAVAEPGALAKVASDATVAERKRATEIRGLVRSVKLDDAFAEKLVTDGVSLDAARAAVLNQLADADESIKTDSHVPVIGVGDDATDKFARAGEAWMIERMGIAQKIADAEKTEQWKRSARLLPKRFGETSFDSGSFRGMPALDFARESLQRAGVETRGLYGESLVGRAFVTPGTLYKRAGGFQTTSDFAVLFENVMHKLLLADYALEPDTWTKFCAIETVSDFRAHNRFRTGAIGVLSALNEHGEFTNKAIPDGQKTAITTATKGNIVGVTRQVIVNDDLGALSGLISALGRAAKRTIEADVYALLAENSGLGPTMSDAQAFFHSNRANVGAGAALSAAALDADSAVMAAQKDISDEDFLNLSPAILLVPRSLRGQAQVINDSQYDPDTVANKSQMKPNVVRGMFREIVGTPRLTGTRRYMFADPSIAPAIVVAFLDGSGQAPTIEQQDGWRTDGVEYRVRQDANAQEFDPNGAVTDAGA